MPTKSRHWIPALAIALGAAGPVAGQDGVEARLQRWITEARARTRGTTALTLAVADEKPVLVFLPGFGGSRLVVSEGPHEGQVLWGRGRPATKKLSLWNAAEYPARAEPLFEYELPFLFGLITHRQNAYGDFWKWVTGPLASEVGVEPHFFAYDWRLDVGEVARQLDEFLRKLGTGGRPIILLTHSWGSSVVWKWQSAYAAGAHPVRVPRMVLMGASFGGVCEIVRAFKLGFPSPPEDAGGIDDVVKDLFVGASLRPALFTMPGAFEHLPRSAPADFSDEDLDLACFEEVTEAGVRRPAPLLDGDFWLKPMSFLPGDLIGQEPWRALRVGSKRAFLDQLAATVAKARRFRDGSPGGEAGVDPRDVRLPVSYVYSAEFATSVKSKRREGRGIDLAGKPVWRSTIEFVFLEPGDGRVPARVARNRDAIGSPGDLEFRKSTRRVYRGHGSLPDDALVRTFLTREIEEVVAAETAARLRRTADAALLPPWDPALEAFVEARLAPRVDWRATASLTTRSSYRRFGETASDVRGLGKRLLAEGDATSAAHVLSGALALSETEPLAPRGEIGADLVQALTRLGKCAEARDVSKRLGIGDAATAEALRTCDEDVPREPAP